MTRNRFCHVCGKKRPENWFDEGWVSIQMWVGHPARYFSGTACKEHQAQLMEQAI